MMKKILILLVLCLFLFSCTLRNVQEEDINDEIETIEDELGEEKTEINVIARITSSGIDPNEILANKGDILVMHITNTNESQIFFVENYEVEGYLAKGSSVKINIELDKEGIFTFGNLMETGKRGTLVVN